MNKIFTKIVGAALGLAMAIGVGVAVGSSEAVPVHAATGTYTIGWGAAGTDATFTATSGTVTFATGHTASFASAKNSAQNDPAYNSNNKQLRLYYASNGNGGSVTFTCSNVTITGFTLTSATSPTLKYSVNGGTAKTLTATNKTYTAAGLSATSSLMFQNGNTTNTQLQISTIAFTYSYSSDPVKLTTPSPSYNDTTKQVSWAAVANASSYQVKVDSGSYATATSPYDVSGLTAGTSHTVYVVAKGDGTNFSDSDAGSSSFTPTAPKVLSSISVSGQTTTFNQGDTWEFGGTVTAHYEDETTADVTSFATFSGYDTSTVGSQTVTVSYTLASITKTTTYGITVNSVPQYELITSEAGLETGAKYIIGNANGTKFLSTTQNSNNRSAHTLAGTIVDNVVTYESGMEVIELGGSAGEWTLKATAGKEGALGYLYAASSSSNYLRTQESSSTWTITFNGTTPTLTSQYNEFTRNILKNNGDLFSCYASGQTDVSLYKLVDTSERIAISKNSVSGLKGDSDTTVSITASNFTPTGITATYSVANIASVTAGTISDGIIPLNVSCLGVGSTVATITVNGGNNTHQIDLSITVTQKPASLTLVNDNIKQGEIDVKLGGSRQISFTALDTDGGDYSINYSGITASSSNSNVRLSGDTNMILNGDHVGDAVVTCTITATVDWQSPITQTLTVHVIEDYNERNVSITEINNVNVEQGSTLVIADHISAATATTHFGTKNNPIKDNELLFSYTDDRSTGVTYSNFVWDVTNPELDEGDTETRTVYVFVTFDESYAGKSFTAIVTVKSRPVVGLKVDGVSKNNDDDINLELSRNSTYNFNEHVTVDPVNATQSHEVVYVVEEGDEYVSVSNGLMTIGSKIGDTVACVSATPAALDSFTVYFWISIAREAMTITADLPDEWNLVTDESELEAGDQIIITSADSSVGMVSYVSNENNVKVTAVTVSGTTLSNIGSAQPLTLSDAGSGKFYINDGTYYLYAASSGGNQLKGKTSQDSTNGAWKFEYSSDHMSIIASGSSNRNVMQYNSGNNPPIISCYATASQKNLQVYKKSGGAKEVTVTDELFNVVNGAMSLKAGSTTLYDLDLCDASGASFSTSAWNTLGNQFTSAIKSDNKLAYARADRNGNEIEQFLATYDYVVAKYGVSYDYLGRIASGKISASGLVNPLVNIIGENTNSVAIIVVVSVLAVTAIGGYFFIRKRKELN